MSSISLPMFEFWRLVFDSAAFVMHIYVSVAILTVKQAAVLFPGKGNLDGLLG